MEKYIPLDALVAEIERRKEESWLGHYTKEKGIVFDITDEILSFLDTLEVKELPIWEKVNPDTGQTTLYKDGCKSYLERFGYRIDLEDLDKLPKKNLKV